MRAKVAPISWIIASVTAQKLLYHALSLTFLGGRGYGLDAIKHEVVVAGGTEIEQHSPRFVWIVIAKDACLHLPLDEIRYRRVIDGRRVIMENTADFREAVGLTYDEPLKRDGGPRAGRRGRGADGTRGSARSEFSEHRRRRQDDAVHARHEDVFELGGAWDGRVEARQATDRASKPTKQALPDQRRHLGAPSAGQMILLDDEHASRLRR